MIYKYNSDNDIQYIFNADVEIIALNGDLIRKPSIIVLNSNNYFEYTEPTMTVYQNKDVLIKVDNNITHSVVDKTQTEIDIINKNWQYINRPIRITVDYTLVEVGGELVSFKDNLMLRQCPYIYDSINRTYTVYITYWNIGEKEMLEGMDNYNTWIADNKLIIEEL